MRILLTILLSLVTMIGFGQSVTAPEPKSFTINTSNQDASGFSLSGFGASDNLLCAIGLPSAPAGTTFYITTTTGLTAASGFTLSGNKSKLVFTGTMSNINNALATLKVNTTATTGTVQISVSATVNPSGYYYNPTNGHFYKPMASGANFANAITISHNTTFKGQTGYLVTITSSDEDLFIYNNVPQSNIWFAADDRTTEGRWIISDGPEINTLLKTSNGQTNGNVPGVYNNWAGGEPNDWGGSEDAAVTKWGGGFYWNDLSVNNVNPYVIEFGTWTNPDNQTFTEFYSNSVNHSNGQTLRTQFTFDFGSNVDETKFKTKMFTYTDYITGPYNEAVVGSSYVALNGLGKVDMTAQMDTAQIAGSGYKATINPGQVEYSYVNPNAAWLNGDSRLLIDMRTFGNTTPSSITNVKIFDAYDGPVTFISSDASWAQYRVPSPLTKITDGTSAYNANIRNVNGWNTDYAFTSNPTFGQNMVNKSHAILFESYNETQLQTLYSQIVTVGDVYLAFKEFADKGIMGNESKYFSTGIQFQNADVNHDNIFDEKDCYKLLQHLQGTESLWASAVLPYMMKIIPKTTYDNITKQNWNTYGAYEFLRAKYPITFVTNTLNAYLLDVTWKGDINLSHSSQPTGFTPSANSLPNTFEIKSMAVSNNSIGDVEVDIMMEKVGDSVIATISVNPNGNEIGATQFNVYFDNSKLEYKNTQSTTTQSSNFARNNGSLISVGSLNTSGGSISNVGYKVIFTPKESINNLLGMVSIKNVETLNTSLNKINVKVQ